MSEIDKLAWEAAFLMAFEDLGLPGPTLDIRGDGCADTEYGYVIFDGVRLYIHIERNRRDSLWYLAADSAYRNTETLGHKDGLTFRTLSELTAYVAGFFARRRESC